MKLENKLCAGGANSTIRTILLLAFGASLFLSGCGPETIWSAESRSPDGKKIASAIASGANSFGNDGGISTSVYLKWSTDSQPPTLILDFVDSSDAPIDTSVEMKWLTPNHLEITYGGNRVLGFQAVKWVDVDISVRDMTKSEDKIPQ